jgi:hypothetical protein
VYRERTGSINCLESRFLYGSTKAVVWRDEMRMIVQKSKGFV